MSFTKQLPSTAKNQEQAVHNLYSMIPDFRIEKESQAVYTEKLHRELCSGISTLDYAYCRPFLRLFLLLEQKGRPLLLEVMVATTTEK
jgi:hypothetical protein